MKSRTRSTGISLAEQDFTRGETPRFDLVILTAANVVQAAGYRAQLARRKVEDGSGWDLPSARKALVVADPKDKRAGSGIATFIALYEAAKYLASLNPKARTLREVFANRRILILHSGGDSRRLPAYAAIGKIFVPLPVEDVHGDPRTVFDLVLEDFAALDPGDSNNGSITIAAGDVMLNLAKTGIDLRPVPGRVVGVAARAAIETGSRHGVFVSDADKKSGDARVRAFLQKPTEAQARAAGAIGKDNTVAIDTGVVILDSDTAAVWLKSLGASINTAKTRTASLRATGTLASMCRATAGSIDLYEHILPTLAGNTAALAKLTPKIAASLSKALAPTTNHFLARHAPAATFYHIGSTRELLEIGTATVFNAGRQSPPRFEPAATVVGSDVGTLALDGPVWIEGCQWGDPDSPPAKFGGFNVITGWPKEVGVPELSRGRCVTWLPVGERDWVCIQYSIDDEWKVPFAQITRGRVHGTLRVLLGLELWNDKDIWPDVVSEADRTLYNAKFWQVGSISQCSADIHSTSTLSCLGMGQDVSHALNRRIVPVRNSLLRISRQHKNAKRLSIADLIGIVNHDRLFDAQHDANRVFALLTQSKRLISHLRLNLVREAKLRHDTVTVLHSKLPRSRYTIDWAHSNSLVQIKADRIRELQLPYAPLNEVELLNRTRLPDPRAFHLGLLLDSSRLAKERSDHELASTTHACAPIRIDLAGGWTDTPPICHAHGGTVINLAASLGNVPPISVHASFSTSRGIHLKGVIDDAKLSCTLPLDAGYDWLSIASASAPSWAKLIPAALQHSELQVSKHAPGISISFSSSVPKGSGLGTSSILSAALCAACYALQGKYSSDLLTKHAIAAATLCVEHAIGSGGGWQDQYGALFPGLKSLSTAAGNIQHAECTPLTIGPRLADMFASRTLLYFTGQQRLAANILQNFVNRYLDGDALTWRTLDRLRKNVLDVREAIDRDDPAAFARHITMYWLLKRSIDPSTTNTGLNRLVTRVTPHLDGYLFPGAGGGGFLFMIARTTASAKSLRRDLATRPPASTARFYDWSVSQTPLTVTVS